MHVRPTAPTARLVQETPRQGQPFADRERLGAMNAAVAAVASTLTTSSRGPARALGGLLRDYVGRPGKRVRPYLLLVGYDLAALRDDRARGARPSGVLTFAGALEVLHAFLLVHDDVADRAVTRRGELALHVQLRPPPSPLLTEGDRQRLGNDLAVVSGDFLYTAALQLMLKADGLPAARRMAALEEVLETCRATAEGQYDDIAYSGRPLAAVAPGDVLEVYERKTARYTFESPLVAGALLGGASEELLAALRRSASAAGMAFQLVDDLLGLFADEARTGKPALADLREAKKTWPLLEAYGQAEPSERAWLEELFVRGDATSRDLRRVRELVRRTGAFARAVSLLNELCDEAEAALHPLAASPAVGELVALVEWLRTRADDWR
jgi:geranylgeranyl diphosphate synthase type I